MRVRSLPKMDHTFIIEVRAPRDWAARIAGTQAREYAPLTLESPTPGRRIAVALEE